MRSVHGALHALHPDLGCVHHSECTFRGVGHVVEHRVGHIAVILLEPGDEVITPCRGLLHQVAPLVVAMQLNQLDQGNNVPKSVFRSGFFPSGNRNGRVSFEGMKKQPA